MVTRCISLSHRAADLGQFVQEVRGHVLHLKIIFYVAPATINDIAFKHIDCS